MVLSAERERASLATSTSALTFTRPHAHALPIHCYVTRHLSRTDFALTRRIVSSATRALQMEDRKVKQADLEKKLKTKDIDLDEVSHCYDALAQLC